MAGKLFGVTFKERTDLPSITPTCAPSRCAARTAATSACSSATTSRGPPSARAPGCRACASSTSSTAGHAPDHRQRHELRQGRAGRADAAQRRRCAHPVPRVRPRPARPAVQRDLSALSGTSVERDFVELPSQLYEHWLERPEVLRKFARHDKTGEPMPEALLQALKAARNFNQGFATVDIWPPPSSTSTCTCWRAPTSSTSTRSRPKTLARSACRTRS